MAAQMGAWYYYGFNSEEDMSPNLIDTELHKTNKLTKDKYVNEEKYIEESRMDNVEEYQSSNTSIWKKGWHSRWSIGTKSWISV